MAQGVVLSIPAEHTTSLGKLAHLGVENRVKLQPRGIVTEGLWARGKSSQCQVLGQNWPYKEAKYSLQQQELPTSHPLIGMPRGLAGPS